MSKPQNNFTINETKDLIDYTCIVFVSCLGHKVKSWGHVSRLLPCNAVNSIGKSICCATRKFQNDSGLQRSREIRLNGMAIHSSMHKVQSIPFSLINSHTIQNDFQSQTCCVDTNKCTLGLDVNVYQFLRSMVGWTPLFSIETK